MSCWHLAQVFESSPINSVYSDVESTSTWNVAWWLRSSYLGSIYFTLLMTSSLFYLLVIISLFICMRCVLQPCFLQALSNQLLCIICLKEAGSLPSAWCYHRPDMATLAPPPLLWHEPPSLELRAASWPFRCTIIDLKRQKICTALNVIYAYTIC